MPDLLPPPHLLAAFAAASLILAVTPGPAVLYIVARSLAQGRAAGLASVAGVALGNLGHALGAALGLGLLLAASSAAFAAVKWLGAGYLLWLGLRAIRTARAGPAPAAAPRAAPLRRIFLDGLVVALLNPKTALFFAAFLPQFLDPARAGPLAAAALGALFVAIAALTDTAFALTAGGLRPRLAGRAAGARLGGYLSGGILIGLGVLTALGQRPARP